MKTPIVKIENLGKRVGNEYLFRNIDWEIYPGENWLLYGENGCGKTSLLSAIAGFSVPTEGTIKFQGKSYNAETIVDVYKGISIVSSSFFDQCFRHESVLEIVLSGINGTLSVPYDVTAQNVRHAKQLLNKLHMLEYANHPYDLLSKGQRQAVLLARAFMKEPQLLILDEPTAGLDLLLRAQVLATIHHLCNHPEIGIIFVTHHSEEISKKFENCLVMRRGKTYAKGDIETVLNEQFFENYFRHAIQIGWAQDGKALITVQTHENERLNF